ncbi:MAG: putative FAD-linked oxidoreductase [Firmicutes bacterium ADurb.Bin182]|nr:MAG: putative FAD-linked oxidoreductase [Firmicutes bacterium ADurb.Bin182]
MPAHAVNKINMAELNHNYRGRMIISELEDAVGIQNVRLLDVDKLPHSVDYYWIPRMWVDRGKKPVYPDCVVYPETTEQVSKVMRIASHYRIPVTPWGGGSGSQGGALPVEGGIVVDLKRMNKVLELNTKANTITAQAGIIQQHLEWEINDKGYSTMHLPASIGCATLGGYLAHRGTGVLSTKYGKIEDMIVSMEVVLPNGDIINTLPVPRNAAGPDLNQFFVGAEGTLGIITTATVKVFEHPECRMFNAFLFKNMHDSLEAGRLIMNARLQPTVIRMYDEPETIHQIERVFGTKLEKGSFLVFGFDGEKEIVDYQMKKAVEICEATAIQNLGSKFGEQWWKNKYKFYFPPYCLDLPQAYGTMDTVATYDKIENIYWKMKTTCEQFPGTRFIAHFSHWYDWGCMMYDRFIVDPAFVPEDPDEAIRLYQQIWTECIRVCLDNGGVINEHHGVGLKLGYMMQEQYGPAFQVLSALKKALDPYNIMNPGKMGF